MVFKSDAGPIIVPLFSHLGYASSGLPPTGGPGKVDGPTYLIRSKQDRLSHVMRPGYSVAYRFSRTSGRSWNQRSYPSTIRTNSSLYSGSFSKRSR
ncbi:hypothetical protein KC361_g37 [Hortaea werneckii]|nr:hypothetical protein KC361_g37 [Hortaea werneckii]